MSSADLLVSLITGLYCCSNTCVLEVVQLAVSIIAEHGVSQQELLVSVSANTKIFRGHIFFITYMIIFLKVNVLRSF